VQQTFSKERTPTVWRIIPSLEFLIKRWESMAEQPKFRDVKDAITNGVDNLKKWYRKVDHTSAAYFICLGMCSILLTCKLLTFLRSPRPECQGFILPSSLGITSIHRGVAKIRRCLRRLLRSSSNPFGNEHSAGICCCCRAFGAIWQFIPS